MLKTYTPTPEDIAKRAARKAEKAAKKAQTEANGGIPPSDPNAPRILKRQWVDVVPSSVTRPEEGQNEKTSEESGRVTVATWNMLAQTLVRESRIVSGRSDSSSALTWQHDAHKRNSSPPGSSSIVVVTCSGIVRQGSIPRFR